MSKFSLDLLFLKRFLTFVKILFPTWRSFNSIFLSAVLFFAITDQITTYYLGVLPKEFHVVLGKRDVQAFDHLIFMALLLVLFKATTAAMISFLSSILYLRCRKKLDYVLHRLYFKRQAFYRLYGIDNPDQRMTQDVEKATRLFSCELAPTLVLSPFITIYYTYLTYNSSGILGPLAIYLFFGTATIVSKLLISPTVALVAEQERGEGDFRARHLEVRNNAEAIAFYQSGFTENVLTNLKLKSLIKTQKHLVKWQFWLNLATHFFDFFGGNLSYVIIAIVIFVQNKYSDKVGPELNGIISENSFYYLYLISSFSKLIALSQSIGAFSGVTHRVIELYDELNRVHDDRLEIERPPSTVPSSVVALASENGKSKFGGCIRQRNEDVVQKEGRIHRELHGRQAHGLSSDSDEDESEFLLMETASQRNLADDGVAVSLDSVTINLHDDPTKVLIMNISLQIMQGKNLLVTGENSVGKTSLFRVIAGLWSCITGTVERFWRFRLNSVFFLPQRPYFPGGGLSLRQQLVYPLKALPVEQDLSRLSRVLEWTRLEHLLQRCNGFDSPVSFDWNELSPSELQLISIGRVLYHKPRIVFLDEATSTLGFEMESHIYRTFYSENITLVSIGHRFSLKQFHDVELNIRGRGAWTLLDIDAESLTSQAQSMLSSGQMAL